MDLSRATSATLAQVLITEQLTSRPAHRVTEAALDRALMRLNRLMSSNPKQVLQHLSEVALELCKAHTVGISILETENGQDFFRWRAMAGTLAAAMGAAMKRNDSPCGMVIDQRASLLFTYPELHFPFPGPVNPPIVDVLLTPFFDSGQPVGTIWVVSHDDEKKFDTEDLRIIKELAQFASGAFSVLRTLGYVQDRRRMRRVATSDRG